MFLVLELKIYKNIKFKIKIGMVQQKKSPEAVEASEASGFKQTKSR